MDRRKLIKTTAAGAAAASIAAPEHAGGRPDARRERADRDRDERERLAVVKPAREAVPRMRERRPGGETGEEDRGERQASHDAFPTPDPAPA